jgi:acyl-CoA synthetase (NDP forming)
MIGISEILDYLVDDANTQAIAIYAESIRQPDRFLAAADRALRAGKPITILKVGRSEIAQSVAKAHTGALVGDDRVFDAVCRRYGITRVDSMEELASTAGLMSVLPPATSSGLGIVSISGGACGMSSDLAAAEGLDLPPFAGTTVDALNGILPSYATTLNPLDVTGAFASDPSQLERSIKAVGEDPSIGRVCFVYDLPHQAERSQVTEIERSIGRGLAACDPPGLLISQTLKPFTDVSQDVKSEVGYPFTASSMVFTFKALGALARYGRVRLRHPAGMAAHVGPARSQPRPATEREVLAYLEREGVPVVPGPIARSADEAVRLARATDGPVALKIASSDIQHKTEVGGVRLDIIGESAVASAYDAIIASVTTAMPRAVIDGVIVSPMRSEGTELIVGVSFDPHWGACIVLGLGGIWVEALKDSALRMLPVTESDVLEMVDELRGSTLLKGFRGSKPVDLDRLAEVVVRIGHAALALGPDLVALEVNPLKVDGALVEALDGLAQWKN